MCCSSRCPLRIIIAEPGTKKVFAFKMLALPFGSVRSVHAFLRVAHSLRAILVSLAKVLTTNYFDDFMAFAPTTQRSSVAAAVQLIFKLLGWNYAATGSKAPPFSELVSALGITLDASCLRSGKVLCDNTESRKLS